MVGLREITDADIPMYKEWLFMPHVSPWFREPQDWLAEAAQRHGAFAWLHQFIAERDGEPVGFCQYYALRDSPEDFGGRAAEEGAYCIDYLLGRPDLLRQGLGQQMIAALLLKIAAHEDARLAVAHVDEKNTASWRLLLSCGFIYDPVGGVYVREL